MKTPRTPGPNYYAMADGRQFWEYEKNDIIPSCERLQLNHWDTSCLLSAAEHFFRLGAKAGEKDTDLSAMWWWLDRIENIGNRAIMVTLMAVHAERELVAEWRASGMPEDGIEMHDIVDPIRTAWGTVNHA